MLTSGNIFLSVFRNPYPFNCVISIVVLSNKKYNNHGDHEKEVDVEESGKLFPPISAKYEIELLK